MSWKEIALNKLSDVLSPAYRKTSFPQLFTHELVLLMKRRILQVIKNEYSKNRYIKKTIFGVRLAKVLKLQPFKKVCCSVCR